MDYKKVLDKIIKDSVLLSTMKKNIPEDFDFLDKDDAIKKINDMFEKGDIISRIYPIYEGIYPDVNKNTEDIIVQLLNDLHYLDSSKRKEIILLAVFYSGRNSIMSKCNSDEISEFTSLRFPPSFKEAIIYLGYDDLFASLVIVKDFLLTEQDLILACEKNNSYVIKYILENGLHFGEQYIKYSEELKYIFGRDDGAFIRSIINNKIFNIVCKTGDFQLIKLFWEISLVNGKSIIDLHNTEVSLLVSLLVLPCFSNNFEASKNIWELGTKDDENFNLNHGSFLIICNFSSEEIIQYIWDTGKCVLDKDVLWCLISHINPFNKIKYIWDNIFSTLPEEDRRLQFHINNDSPFRCVCECSAESLSPLRSLEDVKYMYNLSLQDDIGPIDKSKININMKKVPEEIQEFLISVGFN